MDLIVPIPSAIEAMLRELAASVGKPPEIYAAELLARDLTRHSLDQILAPADEAFRRSGMTDDELAELLEHEKHAMRAEQAAANSSGNASRA